MDQINRRQAAAAGASRSHLAPFVSSPDALEWFETVPGERVAIHVHSSRVGGRFSVMESRASPGSRAPLHYHAEDEIFHIVEGVLTLALSGKIIDADPGTTIVVPARTIHSWENHGAQTVRSFATFLPGGIEDLFSQLCDLHPDQIGAVARSYGTVIIPDETVGRLASRPTAAALQAPAPTAPAAEYDWY